MKRNDELIIRGPALVPFGWLIAIVGASATAVLTAFSIGVWAANISSSQQITDKKVAKMEERVPEISERLVKIETILTYAFPEEAKKARR